MKYTGYLFRTALFFVFFLMLTAFNCKAAVEVGENYVMYDFCEYDGNSSLPYGRGSNAYCYYPKNDSADYFFPELYTWTAAGLSEKQDGVLLYANNKGTAAKLTVDKIPEMYQMSVQRNFRYLLLYVKANTVGENTVDFYSLGNTYKKSFNVSYTGEWQTIVLDLSDSEGWMRKQPDDSYAEISGSTSSPWDNESFGTDGFATVYNSFSENIKNEILIGYYAFSDNKELLLDRGRVTESCAYLEGFDDGLFHGSELLTRGQSAVIAARLICNSLDIPKAEKDITGLFPDITADAYYSDALSLLSDYGCLSVYGESFLPQKPVTAAQLCSLIIKCGLYENGTFDNAGGASLNGSLLEDSNRFLSRFEAVRLVNILTGRKTSDVTEAPFDDVPVNTPEGQDVFSASMTMVIRELPDGSTRTVSAYTAPDYGKTGEIIAEIDDMTDKRISEIRNSANTVVSSYGEIYYVSPDGDDASDGKSEATPWRTLKKVNSVGFSAGDTVLFERGGVWRGQLVIRNGVKYSAYGSGEKPSFYGSAENGADASKWTLADGTANVWRYETAMPDCGSVVLNGGEHMSFKDTPSYRNGIYYHRNSSKVYDYRTDISVNLGIFCDNKSKLSEACTLYMRCDGGNPGELFDSIEFMPRGNILNVTSSDKGALIDNFRIMYSGSHGIGAGTVSGLVVTNCEIGYIGGSIQSYSAAGGTMPVRYGNGVEVYGGCDGYTVENNYIYRIYDAGITHQLGSNSQQNGIQKNISYSDNVIEYCSYSVEYFLGAATDGAMERYMENIVIENNIMRYAGFGHGNGRYDRHCMSHIKSGGSENKVKNGFYIRNNIFDRSREMLINVSASEKESLPLFENNTYIQYMTAPEVQTAVFGRYGEGIPRLRYYSGDIAAILKVNGFEDTSSMYFAQKDLLFDLP